MIDGRREHALRLLIDGCTPSIVADQLGVHRSTVWRWSGEPDFQEAITRAHVERRGALAHRLDAAALQAIDTLCEVMKDASVPPGIRIRAATAILDRGGLEPPPSTAPRSDDPPIDSGLADTLATRIAALDALCAADTPEAIERAALRLVTRPELDAMISEWIARQAAGRANDAHPEAAG